MNRVLTIAAIIFGCLLLMNIGGYVLELGSGIELPSMTHWAMVAQIITLGVLIVGAIFLLKQDGKPTAAMAAAKLFLSIVFVVGILIFFYGERWVQDPLLQKPFDMRTGVPNYMVYQTEEGVKAGFEAGELLHPSDCRPPREIIEVEVDKNGETKETAKAVPVPHEGFDYKKNGTCFSPIDNTVRMRPVAPGDEVQSVSLRSGVSTIWSLVWGDSEADEDFTVTCPRRINLKHLKPGGDQEICMVAGRWHTLYLGKRMGNRTKIRFDDAPLRVRRDFELFPDDWRELVDIAYYGDGSKLAQGLVTDTIRLRAKTVGYRKYLLTDHPVYFEVYIE